MHLLSRSSRPYYFIVPIICNFTCTFDYMFQVHITDGVQFVRGVANCSRADELITRRGNDDTICNMGAPSSNGSYTKTDAKGKGTNSIDILIVDVDSADSR